MDGNENITGKGMDFMSRWQQHYYTWSTKSLSSNKVGLGIVAASSRDRDYLRIAGTEGAKSEPYRQKDGIMIERMNYSFELEGIIRTGSVPSKQGADQRNNRFVHIYSTPWKNLKYPEDYLCSLMYATGWNGQEHLKELSLEEKKAGRKTARNIVKSYALESRLSELCFAVYHCIMTMDKPLIISDITKKTDDFAEFSREMMILIHYLLPEMLRKEADYVSYVTEMTQEAHFLFSNENLGKNCFSMNRDNHRDSYTLLEKEFFDRLATAFLKENDEYEIMMDQLAQVISSLADKRNQLEKCILTIMAPYAGRQKQKDNFFESMERLMYWARKDKSLIKPLEDSIRELDFQMMEEDDLFAYTKLMLTGAGGETKNLAFLQLNQMLNYFYKKNQTMFDSLIAYIRENHGGIYEELLVKNYSVDGFTESVLFEPIKDITDLKYAVGLHKSFFNEKEYEDYLITSAYSLYCKASNEEKQNKIDQLAKEVNEDLFISRKKKDVEIVVNQAVDLKEYLHILSKLNLKRLEQPILAFLYRKAVSYLTKENQIDVVLEDKLTAFAAEVSMINEMEEELFAYYKRILNSRIHKMNGKELLETYLNKKNAETKVYERAITHLYAERYLQLINSDRAAFYKQNTKDWICFVLEVTNQLDKKTAKELIQSTKQAILHSKDIVMLAKANHTLINHGASPIHCPETMWNEISLDTEEDFYKLYEMIEDISLVRCEKSERYQQAKVLYETANHVDGTLEEKAAYAWKKEKKRNRGEEAMEENRFLKAFRYAIEDILSKSIWAVLLGFYGFLFVTIREEIGILISYNPSVLFLILLVILYALKVFLAQTRMETPGSVIYIMGIATLLMNWGLALDTIMGIRILFIAAFVLAIAAKVVHYIFFIRQEEKEDYED